MLIGYARVSTADQSLDPQKDALVAAGCEKVVTDVVSGVVATRHGLTEALEYARKGDTLVVWRLDRLGRSLKDVIETVTALLARGDRGADPRRPSGGSRPRAEGWASSVKG